MDKIYSPKYCHDSQIYINTRDRDLTLSNIKRELSQYYNLQKQYHQVCLEIQTLENQHNKLSYSFTATQKQCLDRIKQNKAIIQELQGQLSRIQSTLTNKYQQIQQGRRQNILKIHQIQEIAQKILNKQQTRIKVQSQLSQQQNIMNKLNEIICNLSTKKQQQKLQKCDRQQNSSKNLQKLNKVEQSNKNDYLKLLQKKQKIYQLNNSKIKLIAQQSTLFNTLNSLLQQYYCKLQENQKLKQKVEESQQHSQDILIQSQKIKENIQKSLMKNKQNSQKLKNLEYNLKIQTDNLIIAKSKKENLQENLRNLLRNNSKTREILQELDISLNQQNQKNQQLNYHMKLSLQRDQTAIKSIQRKNAAIQNLLK